MESTGISVIYDDTIDTDLRKRCKTFLMGKSKCTNGEFCSKYHTYPKDDNIMCLFFKDGYCKRTEEEYWFKHKPWQSNTKRKQEEKPYDIEPMGHLMKRLRDEAQKKKRLGQIK